MEKEIKHVGILGMRWGRRKGSSESSQSSDHKKVSELKKKKLSELSNDDIRIANARTQLEKQYRDLNPSALQKGRVVTTNIFATIGKISVAATAVLAAVETGRKIYDEIQKIKKV